MLNFSIAYGKTAFGLAADWKVSKEEAQATVDAWYAGRPGVKQWQTNTIAWGERDGWVSTLLGRRRVLPNITSKDRRSKSAAQRAAINTPVQGSAADIVMLVGDARYFSLSSSLCSFRRSTVLPPGWGDNHIGPRRP